MSYTTNPIYRRLSMLLTCGALMLTGCDTSSNDHADSSATQGARRGILAADIRTSVDGQRALYRIRRVGESVGVTRDGVALAIPQRTTHLRFSDVTVNLRVAATVSKLSAESLTTLIELYIAYFNRLPDADGLEYWSQEVINGVTFEAIGSAFYNAAIAYSDITGYSAGMAHADFVTVIYRNVLGRQPDDEGLRYWSGRLRDGSASRGSLVLTILQSARTFRGSKDYGYVVDLLDHKVRLGAFFAIQQGLNYNTPENSIRQTQAMVRRVSNRGVINALPLLGEIDWGFSSATPIEGLLDPRLVSGDTYSAFLAKVRQHWAAVPDYLPDDRLQAKWKMVESASSCISFDVPDILPAPPKIESWTGASVLPLYPHSKWTLPISSWPGSSPEPFSVVFADAASYGTGDDRVDTLGNFIGTRLMNLVGRPSESITRSELRSVLISHARANALSEGLKAKFTNTVAGKEPVHYSVLNLIPRLIMAFSETQEGMTVEQRASVGNWINRLVASTIEGSWGSRQDNKAYYRSQAALAWGILIGDAALVGNAIQIFKHALNEMRPDGSFATESARGGSSNMYQASATDSVLSIAQLLSEFFDLNALDFTVKGRSVWTATVRVARLLQDQLGYTAQYGRTCDGASAGTVTSPDPRWGGNITRDAGFLRIGLTGAGEASVRSEIAKLPWTLESFVHRPGVDVYYWMLRD